MCKLFVGFSTPVQNFLVFPCYLLIFLSLIPAFPYFVFFNFYYIITERACLRTLSFYFKIYYLNKYVQKISNIKNRTNSTISFFSSFTKNRTSPCILKNQSTPLRPLYFKKLRRTLQLFVATKKDSITWSLSYKFCIQSPYNYL